MYTACILPNRRYDLVPLHSKRLNVFVNRLSNLFVTVNLRSIVDIFLHRLGFPAGGLRFTFKFSFKFGNPLLDSSLPGSLSLFLGSLLIALFSNLSS